jgi:uncharacterized membrane protein
MWQAATLFSWNHVHPAMVHFTVALLPVSLVTDLIGKFTDRSSLTTAAWWMLLYGAIAAPLTALAGWMWAADIGISPAFLTMHRWLGVGIALSLPAIAIWRGRISSHSEKPGLVYLGFAMLIALVLGYQGFTGGVMTLG